MASPSKGPSFTQLSSLSTFRATSKPRLHALYADITRQKHSNPTSFQANVDWWRRTLEILVARGWQSPSTMSPEPTLGSGSVDRLILHADPSLSESLRFEGVGKPLALGTIITELDDNLALMPLPNFLASPTSIYTPASLPWRVASFVIGKPLIWALQQTGVIDDDGGSEGERERWKRVKGPHVVLSLVDRAAEKVLACQRERTGLSVADSLYSIESFRAEFGEIALDEGSLSDLDTKVLVKFLERERRAVVTDKGVIKFVDPGTMDREVTAVDAGVLELKNGVSALQAQVAEIDRRIDERTRQISEALRAKRKELAMSYLRSRKQLQELYTLRLNSLEQLRTTLGSVETAAGNVEIMRSYESSAATLKAILSHPLLQREKIDETMEALADATAEQREISDLISAGAESAHEQPDEDELAAELDALAKEVEGEQRRKEEMERVEREQQLRELEGSMEALRVGGGSLRESSEGSTASGWEKVAA